MASRSCCLVFFATLMVVGNAFITGAGLRATFPRTKVAAMAWRGAGSQLPSFRVWTKPVAAVRTAAQPAAVEQDVKVQPGAPETRPVSNVRQRLVALMLSAAVLTAGSMKALASAGAEGAGEKLHLGQKVANYIRSATGWPDWVILMVISALPVVELRGGVPVGLWMGIPPAQTFALACLGNFIPVPFILSVLNSSQWLREKVQPRLEKKLKEVTGAKLNWQSLAVFVGVPLPGTGAWTGAAMGAMFNLSFKETLLGTVLGIVSAAMIMTAIVLAGTWGGVGVGVALLVSLIGQQIASRKAGPK